MTGASSDMDGHTKGGAVNQRLTWSGKPILTWGALVVMLVSSLVMAMARDASATFSGRNGRIAFSSDRGGEDLEIYTMRPQGGDVVQVTSAPGNSIFSDWHPDGRRLVFDSDRVTRGCSDEACNVEIFITNVDGTGLRRLTRSPSFDGDPSVSLDGKRIAFGSDRDGDPEIYTMRLDGTHVRQVTHNNWSDFNPSWSPNGRRLAFESDAGRGGGRSAVFTIHTDGSHLRRITPWPLNAGVADWAPGGARLAFATNSQIPRPSKIYTVKADGSELRRITNPHGEDSDFFPSWSPDGRRITFTRFTEDNVDVYAMGRAGRHITRLTRAPAFDIAPDWGSVP